MLKKLWKYCRFAERCNNINYRYGKPPYVWFGIIYLVIISAPYFIGIEEPAQYAELLISIRFVAIIMCTLLITESIWPDIMYRYLAAFWYVTLIYCLPFLSTILILLTNGAIEYVISVAIFTILLISIINWVSAISIATLGIVAAVCFYRYYVCKNFDVGDQHLDFHVLYILGFELVCATAIGMIFIRKKQDAAELIRDRSTVLKVQMNALSKHLHNTLSLEEEVAKGFGKPGVNMVARLTDMEKFYEKFSQLLKKIEPTNEEFEKEYSEVQKTLGFLENLSERSRDYLKLNVSTIALDDFLAMVDECASTYILYSRYSIVLRTKAEEIQCDIVQLNQVLSNVLYEIFSLNIRDELITIEISDTEALYKMPSLPNYEKRVKALQFTISTAEHLDKSHYPELYEVEEKNPRDIGPTAGVEVDRTVSERIIAAHYGVFKSFKENFTTIIVVPQRVREVRSIAKDEGIPEELSVSWPDAIELENRLKEELKKKAPTVSLVKIEQAIDIIKRYHSNQKRNSGEPYYLHPVNVALIELEWCQEEEAILGALMHDLLEDTAFGIMDITTVFGTRVAEIVYGVSKMDARHSMGVYQNDKEHLKSLEGKDFIILSIKISDRLHNMRTLSGHKSEEKRKKIAQETLDFFVPYARELGLNKAHEELKQLAEKVLL